MEPKKSKKADLERSRAIFLEIGSILVLALMLIAFDWNSSPQKNVSDNLISGKPYEVQEIQITLRDETKPKPVQQQKVIEILNIVEDNVKIEDDFNFNVEANEKTQDDFKGFPIMRDETFDDDTPFVSVQDMPSFNGGNPAIEFRKYIAANLRYPGIAAENGISGRVIVQFVVNSKGKVEDAQVLAGVDPALDKEALRVIMSSPLWTPGKQSGKAVKVLFTFPINFILQ